MLFKVLIEKNVCQKKLLDYVYICILTNNVMFSREMLALIHLKFSME